MLYTLYYRSIEDSDQDNLFSACNSHCACEFEYFSPVCGDNNVQYFTACAAGCTNVTEEDGTKVRWAERVHTTLTSKYLGPV